jgi:hypothetical protein
VSLEKYLFNEAKLYIKQKESQAPNSKSHPPAGGPNSRRVLLTVLAIWGLGVGAWGLELLIYTPVIDN